SRAFSFSAVLGRLEPASVGKGSPGKGWHRGWAVSQSWVCPLEEVIGKSHTHAAGCYVVVWDPPSGKVPLERSRCRLGTALIVSKALYIGVIRTRMPLLIIRYCAGRSI